MGQQPQLAANTKSGWQAVSGRLPQTLWKPVSRCRASAEFTDFLMSSAEMALLEATLPQQSRRSAAHIPAYRLVRADDRCYSSEGSFEQLRIPEIEVCHSDHGVEKIELGDGRADLVFMKRCMFFPAVPQ